jgi:hypothetical protein
MVKIKGSKIEATLPSFLDAGMAMCKHDKVDVFRGENNDLVVLNDGEFSEYIKGMTKIDYFVAYARLPKDGWRVEEISNYDRG